MYSEFEYYLNNILFVFVFGHNSESEYYSYSYSVKYLSTNIIHIRIRSFWKNDYYSYSYSVKILIPNNIRIRIWSKKQYSLTSVSRHLKAASYHHFQEIAPVLLHFFYCTSDQNFWWWSPPTQVLRAYSPFIARSRIFDFWLWTPWCRDLYSFGYD